MTRFIASMLKRLAGLELRLSSALDLVPVPLRSLKLNDVQNSFQTDCSRATKSHGLGVQATAHYHMKGMRGEV